MKKLLVGLLVLTAVLALAVELVAPVLAGNRIEEQVREQTQEAAGVDADVGTFPVVTRLLATERVQRVTVTLEEVAHQQITFATVRYELRGLRLDRDALLRGDVRVTGMEGGEVTAEIEPGALTDALGVPVEITDGRLSAAGVDAEVGPEVQGRSLVLPTGGLPGVDLPEDLIPCQPEPSINEDRVRVSCALQDVPFILR